MSKNGFPNFQLILSLLLNLRKWDSFRENIFLRMVHFLDLNSHVMINVKTIGTVMYSLKA